MTDAAPSSQMLDALTQCAYRLGLAFGAEAEREKMSARGLEYFHLFDRCFFSVRVAMGLQLRLGQAERALATEREDLRERADPTERNTARERDIRERERDREREAERASIPLFLKTLQGVAADAANLPGPLHSALPTLRELLAQITSSPAPATTPAKPAVGLRARLTASATAPTLTLLPAAAPAQPTLGLPLRRSTGPPRR